MNNNDDKYLFTTTEKILGILTMVDNVTVFRTDPWKCLVMKMSQTRSDVLTHGASSILWAMWFVRTGNLVLQVLKKEVGGPIRRKRFAEFLLKKHSDYGMPPLLEWKELGILIRMSSKVGRIVNLLENDVERQVEETVEDTLRDLLGYCILGYALTERLKKCTQQSDGN